MTLWWLRRPNNALEIMLRRLNNVFGYVKVVEYLSFFCRKTAVCNRDQLLDISVPGLVRSQ